MAGLPESLSENCVGSCGEGFWIWPRRRDRSIPAAGCDGRANAGQRQKNRARRVFLEKAVSLRCFSVEDPQGIFCFVAPHHPAFSRRTGPYGIFRQALRLREIETAVLRLCQSPGISSELVIKSHLSTRSNGFCGNLPTDHRAENSKTI